MVVHPAAGGAHGIHSRGPKGTARPYDPATGNRAGYARVPLDQEHSVLEIFKGHPAGAPVPAISLRQPWAGAVAFLGKDVENRSRWPFKYRGPIIIHASATLPTLEDYQRLRALAEEDGLEADLLEGLDPTNEETFFAALFEMGGIVAVANLVEVFGPDDEVPEEHPITVSPWAKEDENYWLYFADVIPVEPVPFKGAVGMFKVPYETAMSLRRMRGFE